MIWKDMKTHNLWNPVKNQNWGIGRGQESESPQAMTRGQPQSIANSVPEHGPTVDQGWAGGHHRVTYRTYIHHGAVLLRLGDSQCLALSWDTAGPLTLLRPMTSLGMEGNNRTWAPPLPIPWQPDPVVTPSRTQGSKYKTWGLGKKREAGNPQEAGLCVSPWGMLHQTSRTKHECGLNFKWCWGFSAWGHVYLQCHPRVVPRAYYDFKNKEIEWQTPRGSLLFLYLLP